MNITRSDWTSNFNLIGEVKGVDRAFKIDERSEKSGFIYSSMNIGIDCGKNGTHYAEMMGGYSEGRNNVIIVHGKDDDGRDKFDKKIEISWDDRFDESILEEVGDLSFITVGLEKTDKDKTFYKKFLSQYDAVEYISKHLKDGMVVNIKGTMRYSIYNDKTQVRRNITSIVLSKAESADNYKATFTQSVLIDKNSVSLKNADKEKSVVYVEGRVLDYVKEIEGHEIKGQFPMPYTFEFGMPLTDQNKCSLIMKKMFSVKPKKVTQINFEGEMLSGAAEVKVNLNDVPDDIKELIALGIYTEEEALQVCSSNAPREYRMLLKKPVIRMVGDDDNKNPVVQKYDDKYDESELEFDFEEEEEELPFEESDSDGMDWLNNID